MPHNPSHPRPGPAHLTGERLEPAGPAPQLTHPATDRMTANRVQMGEPVGRTGQPTGTAAEPRCPVAAGHGDPSILAPATADQIPRRRPGPFPAGTRRPAGPASGSPATSRPATKTAPEPAIRSWPLILLAAPASVAVWSGWVGIGRMTGFGQVHPLPGIWDALHLNTAVTLPIGVEAYAAYALRAWLSTPAAVNPAARRFARWSAIASLLLGMAGQIAYHLLTQAGTARAPWEITTAVACLPVLVLGMGTALAHLLRADPRTDGPADRVPCGVLDRAADGHCARRDQDDPGGDQPAYPARPQVDGVDHADHPADTGPARCGHQPARSLADLQGYGPQAGNQARLAQARVAAGQLIVSGERVSRRTLRALGVKGSNADLGMLARIVNAEVASATGDA